MEDNARNSRNMEETKILITPSASEPMPVGEYEAQVITVMEKAGGLYGPELQINLEVVDGKYAGRPLTAWAKISPSMKGKLMRYCVACGLDVRPNQPLNVRDMEGCIATAIVTKGKKNDGTDYNKVDDLVRSTRAAQNAQRRSSETTDDEEGMGW